MKYSLRKEVSLSFVFVIFICVTLIGVLSSIFVEKNFKEYIIDNQEKKNNELVYSISKLYNQENSWDIDSIENIGVTALENGMIIKVTDLNNVVIWDATIHNSGLCNQMMEHMKDNMTNKYPNLNGGYVENKYDIKDNSKTIGNLEIGYYGPYFFTDNDFNFINKINEIIIGVGIFSMLLSLIIGTLIARRISSPILKVVNKTKLISDGYYDGRINEKSNTKEISQLINSVNDLASWI
jgi:methyl-accepting chemotaxis protein